MANDNPVERRRRSDHIDRGFAAVYYHLSHTDRYSSKAHYCIDLVERNLQEKIFDKYSLR